MRASVRYRQLSWHAAFLLFALLHVASATAPSSVPLVIGVDGGTESIRACAFDAHTGKAVGKSCAVPYKTSHPNPGWAEQNPDDWWNNLGKAVRGCLDSLPDGADPSANVKSICVDTTCCSVVALDGESMRPLQPCLLWMDARSAPQTERILEKCRGDPALNVNCGGEGPLSAEWMTCKALWLKENEPDVWSKAVLCEYQDYINYQLTGKLVASSCNAASRWHWDGEECLKDPTEANPYPGRPMSLYKKLGMPELADKLPRKCLPMGSVIGGLSPEAAKHLGLPAGLPVTQGGPDAFVGMIGLGCIHPGQLCLITGSSHLHCVVTDKPTTAPGTWGAYRGAPLPGINFAEGGQSSTGSIIRWAKALFGGDSSETLDYETLDKEAAEIPPGSEGLVALETFQGSRTPKTDALARGAVVGLTLSHTRAHLWRAKMEAVCFGTRACIEALDKAGHACDEIVIAGGATRSPLWLQMHADVTGKPVVLCEHIDAPLLGCAVLASVGAGVHETVGEAVENMVRTARRIEPQKEISEAYTKLYNGVYKHLPDAVRPVVHAIAALRGGSTEPMHANRFSGTTSPITISPSLLAADWSDMRSAIDRCVEAGCNQIHVDIFDGVYLDSPHALTFGPQMIKSLRDYANSVSCNDVVLDIHLCVDRPLRYVEALRDAGSSRIIFQWEAFGSLEAALEMAKAVNEAGMDCGISINPETSEDKIHPLLESGLIDLVDFLAVEPGFGGQSFQEKVLTKIDNLRSWRDSRGFDIQLLVDGGINKETAQQVRAAGADILVAGSFLFGHKISLKTGVKELKQ